MRAAVLALLVAAGCVRSADPAEGGFVSGIAGLAGGGYEARIDEREAAVRAAESRQAALSAELASLEGEHEALKDRIISQRADLRAQGLRLSTETEGRIQAALASDPAQADPAARAAALERAIADARRLSEQLAAMAG